MLDISRATIRMYVQKCM